MASAIGLPALTGLYLVAILCFAIAALILTTASHPRVPGIGSGAALLGPRDHIVITRHEIAASLKGSEARMGLLILAATNAVMVVIMAIAPVHLVAHGHSLGFVGTVVGIHVAGMFVPSPVSGWLADRVGSRPVAGIGFFFLLTTGLMGVVGNRGGVGWMTTTLALLGVGWNFGVVGGSAILAASVPAPLRPHAEGLGEVVMGVAAGAGAPLAGVIVTSGGFTTLLLIAAGVATTMMLVLRVIRRGADQARRKAQP